MVLEINELGAEFFRAQDTHTLFPVGPKQAKQCLPSNFKRSIP